MKLHFAGLLALSATEFEQGKMGFFSDSFEADRPIRSASFIFKADSRQIIYDFLIDITAILEFVA